jgi:hypothetical protein
MAVVDSGRWKSNLPPPTYLSAYNRETSMAVIAHVVLRNVNRDEYDRVRAEAQWLERAPDGGLAHLTWWDGNDCHSVDVWESEAAFAAFGAQRLAPAMERAGVTTQPEVTFQPAHEVYLPKALTVRVT